jgi:hypothetical protein
MFPQMTQIEAIAEENNPLPLAPTDMLMLLVGFLANKLGGTVEVPKGEFMAYVATIPEIMIGPGPDAYVMITSAPGAAVEGPEEHN